MKPEELDEILRRTLDDRRLSRSERKALAPILSASRSGSARSCHQTSAGFPSMTTITDSMSSPTAAVTGPPLASGNTNRNRVPFVW